MMPRCPVCQSTDQTVFFSQEGAPVHVNRLWPDAPQARSAPTAPIELAFCPACTHIFNRAFDPALVEYDPGYENSLFFSGRFQSYAHRLASELIADYDLHAKKIVEIGSGTGEFLRLLCELGENTGFGFDPGYGPEGEQPARGAAFYYRQFFNAQQAETLQPDLVCCRHVLEHLADPAGMLAAVRACEAPVFFEVPNALFTLRDLGIWDVIYEHFSYFTPGSLAQVFTRAGFGVAQVEPVFGGQFLTLRARPDRARGRTVPGSPDVNAEIAQWAASFGSQYARVAARWQDELAQFRAENRRVVVWGAGSKGVSFLNALPTQKVISYIVDINPRKIGRFVPGSAQEVVHPDFLNSYQPDQILVMNANYLAEIEAYARNLGLKAAICPV